MDWISIEGMRHVLVSLHPPECVSQVLSIYSMKRNGIVPAGTKLQVEVRVPSLVRFGSYTFFVCHACEDHRGRIDLPYSAKAVLFEPCLADFDFIFGQIRIYLYLRG